MQYRNLSVRGVAIGSGVVEAANKTLVTRRMKRFGMRWRIAGGQAVLTVRALIKSGRFDRAWETRTHIRRASDPKRRFDRAWETLMGKADTPANDNNCPGYAPKRAA